MSGTEKNDSLQNLNQISSIVSERDKKIWENVAYSKCILKETEFLKSETNRLKTAIEQKKKETKILDDYVAQLHISNSVQQETLKITEQSVIMHQALKENLLQEANSFKTLYAETLEKYNQELKEYRAIYENATQSYKDLKTRQIEMKKLEVKEMMLDAKLSCLKKRRVQFNAIQEQIFQKTIVRFAEFYVTYHKNEALKVKVHETKKVEQQLLKEHLQLTEAVKEKKRMYENKLKMKRYSASKDNATIPVENLTKEVKVNDELQKFLNEEILPCSLTSFPQRTPTFNENNSKVKILDVKLVKPPPPRPVFTPKPPNLELRKKMNDMMITVKNEVKRTNSFQISPQQTQIISRASQQSPRSKLQPQNKTSSFQATQRGSQSKMGSQASQTKVSSQVSQGSQSRISSQSQKLSQNSNSSQNQVKMATTFLTPKETVAGSILKAPVQATEKSDPVKQDSVSKFFNTKKKVVTFQNEVVKDTSRPEIKPFSMFSMEDRQAPRKPAENFNIPFCFSEKPQSKKLDNEMLVETSDEGREMNETGNGFTMETCPTTFTTTGAESLEQMNEVGFNGLTSPLNHDFGEPSLSLSDNFAMPAESATFNFFGAQGTSNNLFCFP